MVSVSIVSFNTSKLLKNCLSNLKNQTRKSKIWVLDNNSKDDSFKMVKKEFPEVKLIESKTNLGFAKGQNEILSQINDKYSLLLNPDTEFDNLAIEKITDFMEKNPDCDIASGILVDLSGKLGSNGGDFPLGWALINWLFNLEFLNFKSNFHREDKEYYSKIRSVDWVAGTFMMVRSEVFKKSGYLSEDFFMYFEDTEFCYRVKKNGGKILINPDIEIKHKSGGSWDNPRFNQWKGEFSGLIKFYKMHFGFLGSLYVRLLIYLATLLRIAAFFLIGKPNRSFIYAKVLVDI